MSKRNWYIGGISVLFFFILIIYFFFPSGDGSKAKGKKIKVSFLDVDPRWADSLIGTLSTEEKAAMLIMYSPDPLARGDEVFNTKQIPGGYLLSSVNILSNERKTGSGHSLIFTGYTQVPVVESKKITLPEENDNSIYGNDELFFAVRNDSLINESKKLLITASDYHGIDGILLPELSASDNALRFRNIYKKDTAFYLNRIRMLDTVLAQNNILSLSGFLTSLDTEEKKNGFSDSVQRSIRSVYNSGMSVIMIDSNFHEEKTEHNQISDFLRKKLKFRGLCLASVKTNHISDEKKVEELLNGGADMILTTDFDKLFINIFTLISSGKIKEEEVNAKVKKILLAKTWSNFRRKKITHEPKISFTAYEKSFPRRFRKGAFTLIKNDRNFIPVSNVMNNRMIVLHFGHKPVNFTQNLYHYLPGKQVVPAKYFITPKENSNFNPADYKRYNTVIVTLSENCSSNDSFIEKLNALSNNSKVIIINFLHPENIPALSKFSTVIQLWGKSVVENIFSAQAVFGAVTFDSEIPVFFPKSIKLKKPVKLAQCRLQYTIPEDIGIAADSLAKIDYIMEEGIRNKAFPGAQVFFAIDGKVFFNRVYGKHTYTENQEVKRDDLYDMASVTKVAATTLIAMRAYEQKLYKLDDSLYLHLPDTLKKHIRGQSTLKNITFRQLLTHGSGLPSGQPILKYIRYRDSVEARFDKYFCDEPDEYYCVQLADRFFMEREQLDTIWYAMNRMGVDENPAYRYSDANMNVLYKLLDAKINHRWRQYVDSIFYKPLGMFNTCYLPLKNEIEPERIVPTENDRYWRKQLLRGYVHDPTAALFGGVAGNAGLFSTAEDMALLFQMLMYGGKYGGITFFNKETVDLFIAQQEGTHRGLGFNRQVKRNTYGVSPYASDNTFGHTGFTGTTVWADMDIKLLYVSCTNRVHPDGENRTIINLGTAKRIHNVIYEQLKYVIPDKIDLY